MKNAPKGSALVFVMVLTLCGSIAYGQVGEPPINRTAPPESKWEFEVIPYLWMAGLKGDVTIKEIDASVDMSFSDIWDDLKFGGFTHIEAKKDRWGLFIDATYMKLETDVSGRRSFSGPLGRRTLEVLADADVSMEQLAIEFGGSYQLAKTPVGQDKGGMMYLDLLAGGRYWYLSGDLDIGTVLDTNRNQIVRNISQSGSKEWIDPFVGLRTRIQLTKSLMLLLRGDIGGFSVGSQFTWNASGYLGYAVSEMVSLWAGYRFLGVDYHDGSGSGKFVYDVTFQGPSVGIGFRF